MDCSEPNEVRYPWQIPLASWVASAKLTPAERRRNEAGDFFEFETQMREEGEDRALILDKQRGFYRFGQGPTKGWFALSRESMRTGRVDQDRYFEVWGHSLAETFSEPQLPEGVRTLARSGVGTRWSG